VGDPYETIALCLAKRLRIEGFENKSNLKRLRANGHHLSGPVMRSSSPEFGQCSKISQIPSYLEVNDFRT
jgi:hypothetical protein